MMLRMKTATDVRRTLQKTANMVFAGELDTKRANTIIYAANSVLASIRIDEQDKQIEALETRINELEHAGR